MNIFWKVESAVDKKAVDDALRLCLALVMSYEFDFDAQARRKINMWTVGSRDFFKRFKFGAKESENAARILVSNKHENNAQYDRYISSLMESLRTHIKEIKAELDVDSTHLKMFNDIRLYFLKDSEAAARAIAKNVGLLEDDDLSAMFIDEVPDSSNEQKQLEALVRKYGKTSGIQMPVPVLQKWQDYAKKNNKKLPEHEQYLKLSKEVRTTFKKFLMNLIRSSSKKYLPIHEVIKIAKDQNISHNLPEGYRGFIDDLGRYYTKKGLLLKQTPVGEVVMNPNYDDSSDNAYVCSFKTPGGKDYIRAYTVDYVAKQKQKNFGTVADILPQIQTLTNKWMVDLKKTPRTRNSVMACILEFIYETGARPGGKDQATKGQQTFGATQLRVSHILKCDNDSIRVRYLGAKSTEPTEYYLRFRSERLKKFGLAMQKLIANKKKEDYVFSYHGQTFTGAMLKRYMTSIGFPKEVSVKNLRTAKGTGMFMNLLKESPFKKGQDFTEKDVNSWLDEQAHKVGAQLGHTSGGKITPNTAIQNYIDPFVIQNFATKLGVRLNAKFLKAIKAARGM